MDQKTQKGTSALVEYLQGLESVGADFQVEDFYLWPRTPIKGDLQEEMLQRTGTTDLEMNDPRSRPAIIRREIRRLIDKGLIPPNFSVLDVPCGDAIVLWQIKKAFPESQCYGVDCYKDLFDPHRMVQDDGVVLFRGFIQHLFDKDPREPFDLVLMLNTYRGWHSADLRDHEKKLPLLADDWFARNARYTIVTAVKEQVQQLRKKHFGVAKIGKGEEWSSMICIARSHTHVPYLQRLRALLP